MRRWSLCVLAAAFVAPIAFAGDMKATLKSGVLTISDSSADDSITIDQLALPDTSYRLTPDPGTTINGSASAQLFSNVTQDVRLKHAEGTDQIELDDLVVARDLVVTASGGIAVTVLVTNGLDVGRDLRIDAKSGQFTLQSTGTGNIVRRHVKCTARGANGNTFVLTPLHVLGDVILKGSAGADVCVIGANVQLVGDVRFDAGGGIDTYVDTATTVVGGEFKVRGKDGTKTVVLTGKFSDDVTTDVGDGDGNTVIVTATQIGGTLRARFGKGDLNVLTINGSTVSGAVECTSKGATDNVNISSLDTGGDLHIKLGAGTNTVSGAAGTQLGGDLIYTGGAGRDQVGFSQATTLGDVRVNLSSAPIGFTDTLTMIGGLVGDDVILTAGAGANGGGIEDVTVLGQVKLNFGSGGSSFFIDGGTYGEILAVAGTGDDTLTITGGTLKTVGDIRALLGSGNNQIPISQTTCGRHLIVRTLGGDDTVSIATSTIVGSVDIDLGGGSNSGP